MSDVTLTSTERSTLLSLQQVTSLQNRTQERLNTGKKVNSATDNAVAFFQSSALTSRANDFLGFQANIDQSIQSINAALTGTSQVETLLQDLKGVVDAAKSENASQRVAATTQFDNIGNQIAQLIKDTSFQGLNILTSSQASLTTQFSNRTQATFSISGYSLLGNTSGGAATSRSIFTAAGGVAFATNGNINFTAVVFGYGNAGATPTSGTAQGFSQIIASGGTSGGVTITATQAAAIFAATDNAIDNAISQVQAITSALATNVNIFQARSNFSASYSNTLLAASNALTLADLNTEAANSTALNLRQQLGIQSLSTSSTQNSSILTLLRAG